MRIPAPTFALALTLSAASICNAQRLTVPVSRLQSPSDSVRASAFFAMAEAARQMSHQPSVLVGPPIDLLVAQAKKQPDLASALIALLERENAFIASGAVRDDEYGDGYYLYVVNAVASLGDKRALKALMPSINSGDFVTTAVADIGKEAVPELTRSLSQSPANQRVGAARALGKIVANRQKLNIDDITLGSIKRTLLASATDASGSFALRSSAIAGLMPLSGQDISTVMHSIANKESGKGIRNPDGRLIYPVRDAARKWILAHDK
jgi:hypothetical protein